MLARCTSSLDLHMLIVPYWYLFRTLLVPKVALGYLFVRCFTSPADAMFICEEFLLHTSSCNYSRGVSLTLMMVCLFLRNFSYTPPAIFIREEFLLQS